MSEPDEDQISPSSFTLFGVSIDSRRGVLSEIKQMIDFVEDIEKNHPPAAVIKEVFYNSVNSICAIELHEEFEHYKDDPTNYVLNAARKHIAQFEWGDEVYHGSDLDDPQPLG